MIRQQRQTGGLQAAWLLGLLGLLCGTGGCQVFGLAASALPPPTITPAYKGLAGQSAAVLVWADQGTLGDFPAVQIDTARVLQRKLTWTKDNDYEEIKGTTWPVAPESIVRDQQDYPQLQAMPITQVAPRYRVSRLIYIEVQRLATRAEASVDLFRGQMIGSVQVLEIENGTARVVYRENDIRAVYPKDAPQEGILNSSDQAIYQGTIDAFTTELAGRFLPHPAEE